MSTIKYISCFVNYYYLKQFKVLYKSYLYYNHKTPFRVYDYDNLPQDAVKELKSWGIDVRKVERGEWTKQIYYSHYGFKWKGLTETDSDVELLIDCDTLFLDNIDDIVDKGEEYDFILVPEYLNQHRNDNLFNIGLMVYNKKSNSVLEETIRMMNQIPILSNGVPNTEMNAFCNYIQDKDLNILELPYLEYMHLWKNHYIKKNLTIDDGKFVVTLDDGTKVRFYHFTTHIDPYGKSGVLRYTSDTPTTSRMWIKRFNNPVGLVYNYLDNYETIDTIKETTRSWKLK